MDKVKIKEIAEELGVKPKEVLDICTTLGIEAKGHSSTIDAALAEKVMQFKMNGESIAPTPAPTPIPSTPPETKVEISSNEKNPEALLTEAAGVAKRKGITIVKKKKEKESEEESINENSVKEVASSSPIHNGPSKEEKLKAQQEVALAAEAARRKKQAKLAKPAVKKEIVTEKIDLFRDRDLSNRDDEREEIVMLPDFSEFRAKVTEEAAEVRAKVAKNFDAKKIPGIGGQVSRGGRKKKRRFYQEAKAEARAEAEEGAIIEIPEEVRVYEFAEKTGHSVAEVIKILFSLGKMVTKNDFLDKDEIEILAEEFGVEIVTKDVFEELDYVAQHEEESSEENLKERAPIVTIMGHVDHGKTSLLDKIRNARVAHGEAGGITQHVGAYQVTMNGKDITFIDTPGHEAFTEMRARGASVTDIAIIVVAADDGVMPQTQEAVAHAKAAGVPFVVAVNKIDKPTANPDFVKSGMAEIGVTPAEWGGDIEFVHVSAKSGEGIDTLLETILIQAELMELKADPTKKAKAIVLESKLEKGRGAVSDVIVKDGTLRVGDVIVVGPNWGRIRAITNDLGKNVKELLPSQPGELLGIDGITIAGETLLVVDNDKIAKEFAEKHKEYLRQKELSKSTKVSFDELGALVAEGQLKRLDVVLKTDVQGSLEAIRASLEKIRNEEVKINIVHAAVGAITESDVSLAEAGENTIIIGFNVKPNQIVKDKAKESGVDIRTYSVLYHIIDDMKVLLGDMLSPIYSEEYVSRAEVREVFVVGKETKIAGCMVIDGIVRRDHIVKIIRKSEVAYSGKIENLKRFKDDVKEVRNGFECGITIENYNEIERGDILEFYKTVAKKATME